MFISTSLWAQHSITLQWSENSPDSEPTSYNIYRGLSSGAETLYDSRDASDTSYIDNVVMYGTPYYYYVTAVNSNGESDPSNEALALWSKAIILPGITFLPGAKIQ